MLVCPQCQRMYPDGTGGVCPVDGTPFPSTQTAKEAKLDVALAGSYRIVRLLGTGGMGSVFLAEQIALGNRHVAIKMLLRKLLDDPEFLKAMEQAVHEPYIATLWLIGPEGRIVWAAGSTAQSTPVGQGVETLATTDTQRIIASLPQGTLDETSRLWLLAASAIRREGEHNDIYRHVLRPIQLSKDNQQAILGVAYLASDAKLSIKPWMFYLFKFVFQISFLIYWLSIPLCVYFDAKQHGEWALVWAAFVLIGNVVALIAYILTRAPRLIRSTPPSTEAGK